MLKKISLLFGILLLGNLLPSATPWAAIRTVEELPDHRQAAFNHVVTRHPEVRAALDCKIPKITGHPLFTKEEFISAKLRWLWRYTQPDYETVYRQDYPVKVEGMPDAFLKKKAYLHRGFALSHLATMLGKGYAPAWMDARDFRETVLTGLHDLATVTPQGFFYSQNYDFVHPEDKLLDNALLRYRKNAWIHAGIIRADMYKRGIFFAGEAPQIDLSWNAFEWALHELKHDGWRLPGENKRNKSASKKAILIFQMELLKNRGYQTGSVLDNQKTLKALWKAYQGKSRQKATSRAEDPTENPAPDEEGEIQQPMEGTTLGAEDVSSAEEDGSAEEEEAPAPEAAEEAAATPLPAVQPVVLPEPDSNMARSALPNNGLEFMTLKKRILREMRGLFPQEPQAPAPTAPHAAALTGVPPTTGPRQSIVESAIARAHNMAGGRHTTPKGAFTPRISPAAAAAASASLQPHGPVQTTTRSSTIVRDPRLSSSSTGATLQQTSTSLTTAPLSTINRTDRDQRSESNLPIYGPTLPPEGLLDYPPQTTPHPAYGPHLRAETQSMDADSDSIVGGATHAGSEPMEDLEEGRDSSDEDMGTPEEERPLPPKTKTPKRQLLADREESPAPDSAGAPEEGADKGLRLKKRIKTSAVYEKISRHVDENHIQFEKGQFADLKQFFDFLVTVKVFTPQEAEKEFANTDSRKSLWSYITKKGALQSQRHRSEDPTFAISEKVKKFLLESGKRWTPTTASEEAVRLGVPSDVAQTPTYRRKMKDFLRAHEDLRERVKGTPQQLISDEVKSFLRQHPPQTIVDAFEMLCTEGLVPPSIRLAPPERKNYYKSKLRGFMETAGLLRTIESSVSAAAEAFLVKSKEKWTPKDACKKLIEMGLAEPSLANTPRYKKNIRYILSQNGKLKQSEAQEVMTQDIKDFLDGQPAQTTKEMFGKLVQAGLVLKKFQEDVEEKNTFMHRLRSAMLARKIFISSTK